MIITIITSYNPTLLSKRIDRGPDGALAKTSSAHLTKGHAARVNVGSLAEFETVLDGLAPNQAIAYGVPQLDSVPLVSTKLLPQNAGAITRSDKHFSWTRGPGIMVLDYDPPAGGQALDQAALLGRLFAACPAMGGSAWLWRPSASGNIYDAQTGEELAGVRGQRCYVAVKEAGDIPRAGAVLFKRSWLAGDGRIEIAANGAMLVRGVVDNSMWQPSRLDFAAGALCGPGLVRMPPPSTGNQGGVLDTRVALPDLTAEEERAYHTAVEQAKGRAANASAAQRTSHIEGIATAEGVTPEEVRARYELAEEKMILGNDFVVELAYGKGKATVEDILMRPAEFHGAICLDPLEPEYNNYHPVGKIYNDVNGAYLDSKAHGGNRVFRLGSLAALAFQKEASAGTTFRDLMSDIRTDACDLSEVTGLIDRMQSGPFSDPELVMLRAELQGTLKDGKRLTPELRALINGASTPTTPSAGTAPTPAASLPLPDAVRFSELQYSSISRATASHGSNASLIIAELLSHRVARSQGGLRWWTGREWEAVADEDVHALVLHALAPDQDKMPNVTATSKAILLKAPELPECARDYRVYFQNGVLDLNTGQLAPHDKHNYNRGCMSVDFTPGTPCPEWHTFLDKIFGGLEDDADRIALLQEIIGFSMLRSDMNAQKIIALDGASRAGKGIILDVIRAIMGPGACGTVSFSDIDDGKTQSVFRAYDVVIDSEAKPVGRATVKKAIGFMNKLASNEEVSIQLLNTQTPWTGKLNCKMLIACNGIPAMMDDSGATTNRFNILYFSRSFLGREDRGLASRLTAEAQAIAMWALDGAVRLLRSGGEFTQPPSSLEALRNLGADNEPMRDFIAEYLRFGAGEKCAAPTVWQAYRIYCLETNTKTPGRNMFYSSLRRALAGSGAEWRESLRVDDTVGKGFSGVGLAAEVANVAAGAFGAGG